MSETWRTDTEPGITRDDLDALDTIGLLQEEIARLEAEIRERDEIGFETHAEPAPTIEEAGATEGVRREIDHLNSELAGREETIAMLLEQTRLLEEAESSSRAEWEQLRQWVEEVERRVEQGAGAGLDLQTALESERRQAEAQRQAAESDRRLWEAQRQTLEKEAEQLRQMISQVVSRSDSPSAALTALEQENQRLRDVCRELSRNSAVAAEIEGLRNQLQDAFKVQDELRSELRRVLDDRDRERIEHEAELAALRSEMALDSIKRQEEQVEAAAPVAQAKATPLPSGLLEADERIRAFRQHLKEIHDVEAEQRMKRTLAARLSRLWRHTGPNR